MGRSRVAIVPVDDEAAFWQTATPCVPVRLLPPRHAQAPLQYYLTWRCGPAQSPREAERASCRAVLPGPGRSNPEPRNKVHRFVGAHLLLAVQRGGAAAPAVSRAPS